MAFTLGPHRKRCCPNARAGSSIQRSGPVLGRRSLLRTGVCFGIAGLGLGALTSACSLVAEQRPFRIPRIGFLGPGPRDTPNVASFLEGMRDVGYVDGQNIVIEWRLASESGTASPVGADASMAQLPSLAAQLVSLPVDLLVAQARLATLAAKQATTTIPIVFMGVGLPVANGLVASIARPGGNLTGFATDVPGIWAKRLELLRQAVPGLTRVAVLHDAAAVIQGLGSNWEEVQQAAEGLGLLAQRLDLQSPQDLEVALRAAASDGAQAVINAAGTLLTSGARRSSAEVVLRQHLPSITYDRPGAADGWLMGYGPDLETEPRKAGRVVDRILKGARPAELPVEQPTILDLAVNAKTLEVLGLTLPPSMLPQVTEWIA